MRGLGKTLLGSAALALCAALACSYSPDFGDDLLHCSSDGKCPEGYACRAATSTCWKIGGAATGVAGTTGAAGTSGAAGTIGAAGVTGAAGTSVPLPSVNNFAGKWLFQAGSTQTINCLDGSMSTKSLATDYVDVEKRGPMALMGSYYCDWNLTVDATFTKTSIPAGQSCPTMDTAMDGTVTAFVWKGTKFVLTTLDGVTGTLLAEIGTDYTSTTTANVKTTGSCALKISGTLLKAVP